jgi:DNA replication and repair protein RecF
VSYAIQRAVAAGVGPSRQTWLSRLTVTRFRNYEHAELAPGPGPVVLTGPNGAGKTNLLEAVSLFSPGRGLRRARLGDLGRCETPGAVPASDWAVSARLSTAAGERRVGTGLEPGDEAARRVVRIDGESALGQQALAELLSVVWLTPQMDGLFREGAAGRRRFLDRLVYAFDPSHASRLSGYEQALRRRARLLRERGQRDPAWLAGLEEAMAGHGIAVAAARRQLVARLGAACAAGVGPFPRAGLDLDGMVERALQESAALDAEDAFRAALARSRDEDRESGGAAQGPHRADLLVRHLERGRPAEQCSTGEQKALLIAIVLAHARLIAADRGTPPVLLLDEVVAHLDDERRRSLYDELLVLEAQVWLTGTVAGGCARVGPAARRFQVRDAVVAAA